MRRETGDRRDEIAEALTVLHVAIRRGGAQPTVAALLRRVFKSHHRGRQTGARAMRITGLARLRWQAAVLLRHLSPFPRAPGAGKACPRRAI